MRSSADLKVNLSFPDPLGFRRLIAERIRDLEAALEALARTDAVKDAKNRELGSRIT